MAVSPITREKIRMDLTLYMRYSLDLLLLVLLIILQNQYSQ